MTLIIKGSELQQRGRLVRIILDRTLSEIGIAPQGSQMTVLGSLRGFYEVHHFPG